MIQMGSIAELREELKKKDEKLRVANHKVLVLKGQLRVLTGESSDDDNEDSKELDRKELKLDAEKWRILRSDYDEEQLKSYDTLIASLEKKIDVLHTEYKEKDMQYFDLQVRFDRLKRRLEECQHEIVQRALNYDMDIAALVEENDNLKLQLDRQSHPELHPQNQDKTQGPHTADMSMINNPYWVKFHL